MGRTNTYTYPYSKMGFLPLGKQFRCGISPIQRITLKRGLLILGGTRSLFWVGHPIRKMHPICHWVVPPHSYTGPRRGCDHMYLGVFMKVFLIGLAHVGILQLLPKTGSDKYHTFNFICYLHLYTAFMSCCILVCAVLLLHPNPRFMPPI